MPPFIFFYTTLPILIFSTFPFKKIRVYEIIILLHQAQSVKILQKLKALKTVFLVFSKLTMF